MAHIHNPNIVRCCFSVLCASALSGRRGIPPRNMVLYLRYLNFSATIFKISDCCNSFATLDCNSFTTNFSFVSSSQIHRLKCYVSAEIRQRRCRESEHPPAKIRQQSTRLRQLEHQPANLRFQKEPFSWLKPSLSQHTKNHNLCSSRRYEENPLTRWTSSPPSPSSSGRNSTKKAKQSQQGLQ